MLLHFPTISHPLIDPKRLFPNWCIPVPLRCRGHTSPLAQEPHPELGMWHIYLQGGCTERTAQGVGSKSSPTHQPIYSHIDTSHCADVISLAKEATVVRTVAPKLIDLAMFWVQSPSDYDILFAKMIPAAWAKEHHPVLSRHGHKQTRLTTYISSRTKQLAPITFPPGWPDDHILFTMYAPNEPKGQLVPCPLQCGQVVDTKVLKNGLTIRFRCLGCQGIAEVEKYVTSQTTKLGHHALVAVPYPQGLYPATWVHTPVEVEGKVAGKALEEGESVKVAQDPPRQTGKRPRITKAKPSMASSGPSIPDPPPSKGITRSRTSHPAQPGPSIRITRPDEITRSTSLPTASTSAIPSSTSLKLRIPRMPSTPGLSSLAEGSSSAAATPPPPSPQEPAEPRKRSPTHRSHQGLSKRLKKNPGRE